MNPTFLLREGCKMHMIESKLLTRNTYYIAVPLICGSFSILATEYRILHITLAVRVMMLVATNDWITDIESQLSGWIQNSGNGGRRRSSRAAARRQVPTPTKTEAKRNTSLPFNHSRLQRCEGPHGLPTQRACSLAPFWAAVLHIGLPHPFLLGHLLDR